MPSESHDAMPRETPNDAIIRDSRIALKWAAGRKKPGLFMRERLLSATCEEEIKALLRTCDNQEVSPETRRRWQRAANKRMRELEDR